MKFEPIYIEAHNHLREADTNRNQIINYYLIAVGAYTTIMISFIENSSNNILLLTTSGILLSIYGFIQALNLVEHRKWHTRYTNTARLISRLQINSRFSSAVVAMNRDLLNVEFGINKKERLSLYRFLLKKYIWGEETKTYSAFLLLTSIPIATLITIHFPQCWQIMIGLIITYLIVLNLSAAKSLFGDYNNKEYKIPFPSATWLLEGVAKSDQIFSYIDSNKKQKIH